MEEHKARKKPAFQKRVKRQTTVLKPISGAAVGAALISSPAVTFLDSAWGEESNKLDRMIGHIGTASLS